MSFIKLAAGDTDLVGPVKVKKQTLGQQWAEIQEKYAGQKTQTVRETTDEMGKAYMKSLWEIIQKHNHLTKPYYILEVLKPDTFLEGAIRLWHIARWTRPTPEWGLALYKVDNEAGDVTYEWGLPHVEEAIRIMEDIPGSDPKLVQDILDFKNGVLR